MSDPFNQQLKDSGKRSEFATGAVRDDAAGRGRLDLLPWGALENLDWSNDQLGNPENALKHLTTFGHNNDFAALNEAAVCLFVAVNSVVSPCYGSDRDILSLKDIPLALIELAKHFEKGALKYEARNWEKGINYSRYLDSAFRHLLQHLAGKTDEPHLIAALWNVVCLIQTDMWVKAGRLPSTLSDLPSISNKGETAFEVAKTEAYQAGYEDAQIKVSREAAEVLTALAPHCRPGHKKPIDTLNDILMPRVFTVPLSSPSPSASHIIFVGNRGYFLYPHGVEKNPHPLESYNNKFNQLRYIG